MATQSTIEWTEQTWNPTTGCTKVSPGCKNCYAEVMARRLHAMGTPGYENEFIVRVTQAVGKKSLKTNPDTQLLEDVAGLVFIEHYMLDFAGRHPEYDEQKWIEIIRRIWNKISVRAHQYALAGHIKLPDPLVALIKKAVSK